MMRKVERIFTSLIFSLGVLIAQIGFVPSAFSQITTDASITPQTDQSGTTIVPGQNAQDKSPGGKTISPYDEEETNYQTGEYKVQHTKSGTMENVLKAVMLFAIAYVTVNAALICKGKAASFWVFYASAITYIAGEVMAMSKQKKNSTIITYKFRNQADQQNMQADAMDRAADLKMKAYETEKLRATLQMAAGGGMLAAAMIAKGEASNLKKLAEQCGIELAQLEQAITQYKIECASKVGTPAYAPCVAGLPAASTLEANSSQYKADTTKRDGELSDCNACHSENKTVVKGGDSPKPQQGLQPPVPDNEIATEQADANKACSEKEWQKMATIMACTKEKLDEEGAEGAGEAGVEAGAEAATPTSASIKNSSKSWGLEKIINFLFSPAHAQTSSTYNSDYVVDESNSAYNQNQNQIYNSPPPGTSINTFSGGGTVSHGDELDGKSKNNQMMVLAGLGGGMLLAVFTGSKKLANGQLMKSLGHPEGRAKTFSMYGLLALAAGYMSLRSANKLKDEAKELRTMAETMRIKAARTFLSLQRANEMAGSNVVNAGPGGGTAPTTSGAPVGTSNYDPIANGEYCFGGATSNNPTGFDPKCSCQKTNSCQNVSVDPAKINAVSIELPTPVTTAATDIVKAANAISKGDLKGGVLAASSVAKKAGELQKLNTQVENKFNEFRKKLGQQPIDFKKERQKLLTSLTNGVKSSVKGVGDLAQVQRAAANAPRLASLEESESKEAGDGTVRSIEGRKSKGQYIKNMGNSKSGSLAGLDSLLPDNGLKSSNGINDGKNNLAEINADLLEKHGLDGSDIVDKPEVSIWKVISNRYLNSVKRLIPDN